MLTIDEAKKIIEKIINSPTNPLTQENEDFIDACEKNEIEKAQEILKKNPDLDINWSSGPLDYPEEILDFENNEEIIKLFLQIPDKKLRNCTALAIACEKGNIETVHFLLGLPSIDINCTSNSSASPLACAAATGRSNIVVLILKNKKLERKKDMTALLFSTARHGMIDVFKRIVAMGWITNPAKSKDFDLFLRFLNKPELNPQRILAKKELTETVALFIMNPEKYKKRVKKELYIS